MSALKLRLLFLSFVFLICLIPSIVKAASFDCKKASTEFEYLICDNADLNRLDEDLGKAYKLKRDNLSKDGRDLLKSSQRNWLKYVQGDICKPVYLSNFSGGLTRLECVVEKYQSRIRSLTYDLEINSGTLAKSIVVPMFVGGSIGGDGVCSHTEETQYLDMNPKLNEALSRLSYTYYIDPEPCVEPDGGWVDEFEQTISITKVVNDRFLGVEVAGSSCCGAHGSDWHFYHYYDLLDEKFLTYEDVFNGEDWFDVVKKEAGQKFVERWKDNGDSVGLTNEDIEWILGDINEQTPPSGSSDFSWQVTSEGFSIVGQWFPHVSRAFDEHDIAWSSVKGHLTPLGLLLSGQH